MERIWFVIQEGGSSGEAYAASYSSSSDARKAIRSHHAASYRTKGPYPLTLPIREQDVLALLESVSRDDYK